MKASPNDTAMTLSSIVTAITTVEYSARLDVPCAAHRSSLIVVGGLHHLVMNMKNLWSQCEQKL